MRVTLRALPCAALLLLLVPLAGLALAGPALAADAAGPLAPVLADLRSALGDALLLALLGLGSWALKRTAGYLHIQHEDRLVQRLEDGMLYALLYARETLLGQGRPLDHSARADLPELAAAYLTPKMPDTMAALGIDGEGLRERLLARLDQVVPLAAPANGVSAASAGQ